MDLVPGCRALRQCHLPVPSWCRLQTCSRMLSLGCQLLTKAALKFLRYGISNEPMAAKRYEEVLQTMGHDVTVVHCGLLVNPAFPWLGASPDRLVFDPAASSYGVLEIKCPYSLSENKGEELATATFCSELTESDTRLTREDYYYAPLVGQMGVSALSWGASFCTENISF
ncbi:hypothetical protein HPB49_003676 [Dermacentor silvarum]|uniref:Uncharacterized protein n=1 Tax=Dermacentor silvarum TaxID=543639 RepID=A0ACB8DU35_DERSI|nr:hypothetical protein HPB49_003676 [Dermacentor silvarum]